MKSKHIKVVSATRYLKHSTASVPQIRMEGRWLESLGFSIGATLMVEYEEGAIRIRPLTESESAAREHLRSISAIKQEIAKLKSLESTLQAEYDACTRASNVAEAAPSYGTN